MCIMTIRDDATALLNCEDDQGEPAPAMSAFCSMGKGRTKELCYVEY